MKKSAGNNLSSCQWDLQKCPLGARLEERMAPQMSMFPGPEERTNARVTPLVMYPGS